MTANQPMHSPVSSASNSTPRRSRMRAVTRALVVALLTLGVVAATPQLRPARDPATIQRLMQQSGHAGDCDQCHTMHGDQQPIVYPTALVGPDDNTLCERCHTIPWEGGSYAGPTLYLGTGHGSSTAMIWPGPEPPARIDFDARGKCLNCHDPHGYTDLNGVIPKLALAREEQLCLTCHDGSPAATNVSSELAKPYRHPVTDFSGRHTGPAESQPAAFGTTPLNARHSECEDCHNAHVSRRDPSTPYADDASLTTLGVSRLSVLNGPAGSAPSFTFIPGSDTLTAPVAEYQLCFKCHSSWTTQPAGQTDLARVMNPNNPSYHPTEAPGANPMIDPLSFAAGWGTSSITRCGDCHGSDFGANRGPHGSIYPAILKRPYTASSASHDMTSDELCFSCHSYDVYANPTSPDAVRGASRFNRPGTDNGHVEHVGGEHVPCYGCHQTHGSATQPFLIATGRNPGMLGYTKLPTGGLCTPTCHGPQQYTVNYAR